LERPAADGPFGAKGRARCAQSGIPAVANAIFNAVGIRVDDLRSRRKKYFARSARRAALGRRRVGNMAVRSNIVGIGQSEALERALRSAYYLADEAIATSAYLALHWASRVLEARPASAKTEAAKAIAAVLARRLIRCNATRASTLRPRCTNGLSAPDAGDPAGW